MKALVFHRPGHVEINDVPDPKIEHDEDIILWVTSRSSFASAPFGAGAWSPSSESMECLMTHFRSGQIFDKGITMRFGQAPVQKYIDELIGILERGEIKLDDIITHRLPLDQAPHAYQIFRDKEDNCVKVVLKP
jgi:threonine dehydrogenase-like Zn-dependent dehydrogenase